MRKVIGGAAIVAALAMLVAMTQAPEDAAAPASAGAAPAGAASLPSASRPPQPRMVDYRLVDARLKRLMAEKNMVGLAIGIVEDGQVTYLRGYGETLRGTGDPVTADTVFRWASVSKGVASTLVAGLADEGKLSLDDPISRYARSLRLPGGNEARATVANVLSHRLGLPSNAEDPALEDGVDPHILRGMLATMSPICPVGTCHAYQNVGYDAASELVEKVAGAPYEDVARARIFGPLGMKSASVSLNGLVSSPSWARPHDAGGRPQARGLREAYYHVPAAGGVNSSIRDLARWMQAQMGETPHAVPPAVVATLHSPRVATPGEDRRQRKHRDRIGGSHYALGWRTYDYAGHHIVGHHGGISGYRASVMFDPELRSGVVALWNSSNSQPGGFELEVLDMIYGLDRRDWLELDTRKGQVPVPIFANASAPPYKATRAQIGR